MPVQTRYSIKKKLELVNSNLYNWLKQNNLIYTQDQVKQMGLNTNDCYKVIWHEYVYSCPSCAHQYLYAVAPEGYYWKEYIDPDDEYTKEIFGYFIEGKIYGSARYESAVQQFRYLICQSFILDKII
jgi:hypothetical protein